MIETYFNFVQNYLERYSQVLAMWEPSDIFAELFFITYIALKINM